MGDKRKRLFWFFFNLEEVELCNTGGSTEKYLRSRISLNISLPFIVLDG